VQRITTVQEFLLPPQSESKVTAPDAIGITSTARAATTSAATTATNTQCPELNNTNAELPSPPLGTPFKPLTGEVEIQGVTGSVSDSTPQDFSGRWTGWLSGNDPRVRVILELQCAQTRISGTLLWISSASGTKKRALSGNFNPDSQVVLLKDEHILFAAPKGHWFFCPIDKYELRLVNNGQELSGSYLAPGCPDRGTLLVRKAEDTDGMDGSTARPDSNRLPN